MTPARKRVGVIGTFVWDVIYGRPPHDAPVEEWGSITYSLSGLDAALPNDWEIVPLMKIGSDMTLRANKFLAGLEHIAPDAALVEVPYPNNRVELRYFSDERRTEVLTGSVPGWNWLALKPLMFVIEIISHLARPLSLTLRLFGNMVGGHILLAIIFFLMGLQGLIGWALSGSPIGAVVGGIGGVVMVVFTVGFLYPLKILVSFLQAFIFVMLTMLYISGAIEEAEHHGGEHAPAHH